MPVTTVVPDEYTECAADISALVVLQVSSAVASPGSFVQFIAAASQPADGDRGLMISAGETVVENYLPIIGSSGKLWGKSSAHNIEVFTK